MQSLKTARRNRWCRKWFQIWFRDTISPIFDARLFLRWLSIPAILLFIWVLGGRAALIDELTVIFATALVFLFSVPLWILMQGILALFKVGREERALGFWDGNTFVYHEPMHVQTIPISPEDNRTFIEFDIPKDVEVGAVATFTTEIDGPRNRIKLTFLPQYAEASIAWGAVGGQTGFCVPENRKSTLLVQMKPDTVRSRLRIYLVRWEI